MTKKCRIGHTILVVARSTSLWSLLSKETYVPKPPGYLELSCLRINTPHCRTLSPIPLKSLHVQSLDKTLRLRLKSTGSKFTNLLSKQTFH